MPLRKFNLAALIAQYQFIISYREKSTVKVDINITVMKTRYLFCTKDQYDLAFKPVTKKNPHTDKQ